MSFTSSEQPTNLDIDFVIDGFGDIAEQLERFLFQDASRPFGLWSTAKASDSTYAETLIADSREVPVDAATVSETLQSIDGSLGTGDAEVGQAVLARVGVSVPDVLARIELARGVLASCQLIPDFHVNVVDVGGEYSGVVISARIGVSAQDVARLNRQLVKAERSRGMRMRLEFDVSFSAARA